MLQGAVWDSLRGRCDIGTPGGDARTGLLCAYNNSPNPELGQYRGCNRGKREVGRGSADGSETRHATGSRRVKMLSTVMSRCLWRLSQHGPGPYRRRRTLCGELRGTVDVTAHIITASGAPLPSCPFPWSASRTSYQWDEPPVAARNILTHNHMPSIQPVPSYLRQCCLVSYSSFLGILISVGRRLTRYR